MRKLCVTVVLGLMMASYDNAFQQVLRQNQKSICRRSGANRCPSCSNSEEAGAYPANI